MIKFITRVAAIGIFMLGASLMSDSALAQDSAPDAAQPAAPDPLSVLQGRPDVVGSELLGGTYQNPLAGIAFRVPAPCQQVAKGTAADEIARFADDKNTWQLIATETTSGQPIPLAGKASSMGLLEVTAARLKQMNPAVDIIRQDTMPLGDLKAGIIVARLTTASTRRLWQQAIIQANDQLYYSLVLTSPADEKDEKGKDSADPIEKKARETFLQMLNTVKLLDRAPIKEDQDERLYRTRGFFVNLTPARLKAAIIPEQWLRLQRDGKDIGYTYIIEEPGAEGAHDGIKIGLRSRTYPDAGTQVDGESWYFISLDRNHETWSNLVWVQNLEAKTSDQYTEIGSSDRRLERELDTSVDARPGDAYDKRQPPVVTVKPYTLTVQTISKSANQPPITRQLPPFYLPQALGQLLPRLLPLREPQTFLFATYVSEKHEVMMRYVDVGNEQDVALGGKQQRAIPISERVGLEGSPTVHYMSPDGKYLGTVNQKAHITLLPCDAATLQKIWQNKADLTRPRSPEQVK